VNEQRETIRRNVKQPSLIALGSLVLLFGVSSCGGSAGPAADSSSGPSAAGQPGGVGGPGIPGASGEVAQVSGRTMQVQSQLTGQVAVTWTSRTTFTQQVSASLSDVASGDCVIVGTSSETTTGSPIAAETVRIIQAVDGGCTPGGGAGQPDGAPTEQPSDLPSDLPSNLRSGGPGGGGGGTFGEVTTVTKTGFTVEPVVPGGSDAEATEVSVSVGADTTFTTTAEATAKAVRVGRCVDARGDADSTGAVTAESVSVSAKVDGECGVTFGARTDQGS
jgi:hypothetical protein